MTDTALETAVADIGQSIFGTPEPETEIPEPEGDETQARSPEQSTITEPEASDLAPPVQVPPPKSWAKDTHEMWGKLDPKAQEYVQKREKDFLDGLETYKGDAGYAKQLREVVAPYKAMLAAQGISEVQGVQYLLNAQYRLTSGTPEERQAAWREIGKTVGLVMETEDSSAPAMDPAIKALREELNGVKSELSYGKQLAQTQARSEVDKQISAFASDPANLYFAEVEQDMLPFVKEGFTLKDAYEKAVWANPTTRAKELARIQTDAEAARTKKAREEGNTAKKATAFNVRGSESRKAPTEPKGSMDDTIRETYAAIKAR